MHYLTGIIVKNTSGCDDFSDEDARSEAKSTLERYDGIVFDYYADDPGRWSATYGGHGVFRATSQKFFEVLNTLLDAQKETYKTAVSHLEDINYYKAIYEAKLNPDNGSDRWAVFLKSFANRLTGEFDCDSHIFDGYDGTSFITTEMIDEYKIEPDKYWLVLFDIHY